MARQIANKSIAVVPADDRPITGGAYGTLYVGGGGDLKIMLERDTVAITLVNIPDGSFIPLVVQKVFDTGTDCTNIIAFIDN